MGISANQFWATSKDGKAMLLMLARRGDVEVVRDVCEWLVDRHTKDVEFSAVQKGATKEQAHTFALARVEPLRKMAEGIKDRTVVSAAAQVVDAVFDRHRQQGKATYDQALEFLADTLRKKVVD